MDASSGDQDVSADTVVSWFRDAPRGDQVLALKQILDQLPVELLPVLQNHLVHLMQRDFLSLLPQELNTRVLSYLDARDLCHVEEVCRAWSQIVDANGPYLWGRLCAVNGWDPKYHVFRPGGLSPEKAFFKYKSRIERNWAKGKYTSRQLTGHTRVVFCVQMEADRLYSSSFDNTIRVWNLATNECERVLEGHTGGVSCIRVENGVLVSGSSDSTLKVWDLATGECVRTLEGHTHEVTSVYHDDVNVVSGSCDCTLRVWRLDTGECEAVLRGHTDYVVSIQFDAEIIASGSFDKTVKIWDRKTLTEITTLRGHMEAVKAVRFDKDVIVSASLDRVVRVWSRRTHGLLAILCGHTDEVWCVQLLYTGLGDNSRLHKLVSGGRDGVRVWRVHPNYESELFVPLARGATCVDVDPCTIAIGSFDKTITLLDFSVGTGSDSSERHDAVNSMAL